MYLNFSEVVEKSVKVMDLGFSEAYGEDVKVCNIGSGPGFQKVGLYHDGKLLFETSYSVTGNLTQWIYNTRSQLKEMSETDFR
jgi:hypothetical protein